VIVDGAWASAGAASRAMTVAAASRTPAKPAGA
jgi:hypothetical protein